MMTAKCILHHEWQLNKAHNKYNELKFLFTLLNFTRKFILPRHWRSQHTHTHTQIQWIFMFVILLWIAAVLAVAFVFFHVIFYFSIFDVAAVVVFQCKSTKAIGTKASLFIYRMSVTEWFHFVRCISFIVRMRLNSKAQFATWCFWLSSEDSVVCMDSSFRHSIPRNIIS